MHLDKNMKYISKPGIYRGDERQWNRMVADMKIKDFLKNNEPHLSFGQRGGDWWGSCCRCSDPKPQLDQYAQYQLEIKSGQASK
jgi:hypothetical protein